MRAQADASRQWFAVFTTPRHEKCVAAYFEQRQLEGFLPTYQAVHRWRNGQNAHVALPLFPGYLFVRIDRCERIRVLEVPGVLAILGTRREMTALSEAEIEWLRSGVRQQNLEPHPYLVAGERVRIRTGAMEGLEGILVRRSNGMRVVLTLELIRQSVAVELSADDIELAEQRASA